MDAIQFVTDVAVYIRQVGEDIAHNMRYVTDGRITQAHKARNEVRGLVYRFVAWRAERPELYVSQCPYMQQLLRDMRLSYHRAMLFVRFPYDERNLKLIDELLNERPPRDTQPDTSRAPASRGSLYFYCKWAYGRRQAWVGNEATCGTKKSKQTRFVMTRESVGDLKQSGRAVVRPAHTRAELLELLAKSFHKKKGSFKLFPEIEKMSESDVRALKIKGTLAEPVNAVLHAEGYPSDGTMGSLMDNLAFDKDAVHRVFCYCHSTNEAIDAAEAALRLRTEVRKQV